MRIHRTVMAEVPLERAYAFLSDFTTTMEWEPATIVTELVSGDGGVGTVYRNVSRFNGNESEVIYTVTDVEPNRKFALRGENSSLVAHDTMTFHGDEHRTTVTYEAVFDLKGLRKLAAPFLAKAFRTLGDDAEEGLARTLARLGEGQDGRAQDTP